MASLQELLTEEGFEGGAFGKDRNSGKERNRISSDDSKLLPIFICHDRKSVDFSNHKNEKTSTPKGFSKHQSKRVVSSASERSNSISLESHRPAMDEVAIRALISILSGYVGRYIKDTRFRRTIREKCHSCLMRRNEDSDNGVLENMVLGMEEVEKLVEEQGTMKKQKQQLGMKTLTNSIQLLTIAAALNSSKSRNGSTCGIPNCYISALAQLYLAILYKVERNDRVSARHLLQVFCDSPFLARTNLLPELWEHFFLPHLLHLKIWYTKELDFLSSSEYADKEKKTKSLSKLYNDQMDKGTTLFALYYKDWLKVGSSEPPLPTIPLPSRSSNRSGRRTSSETDTSHTSINRSLYRAVFGPVVAQQPLSYYNQHEVLNNARCSMAYEKPHEYQNREEDNYDITSLVHEEDKTCHGKSSMRYLRNQEDKLWFEPQKLDYFQCFPCRSIATGFPMDGNHVAKNASIRKGTLLPRDFSTAITTIRSSDILSECELAIRVVTKAWLDSHGDPLLEDTLSKAQVVEGMLEVLYASSDEEILELVISILAELVHRKEVTKQIILNLDPQLEIFIRLLRSSSLFLKAAVLLYLSRPQAKQMISPEWVPLVLRVLEFANHFQILFTVQCNPQVAAYYLLDQLLTGFNEDKNFENARQVVSIGGLSLLAKRFEIGDILERFNVALVISCCIQAEGSCRNFLAENLNKAAMVQLIALGNNKIPNRSAFSLLAELLCLNRRTKISSFLNGLKEGWGGLNTKNIFLAYLQRAPPEECPLIATILLMLDLMEDPMKSSLYREEAVDSIIASLNCQMCNRDIQEQSARALLMLGGRFSSSGDAVIEKQILQKAGFQDISCLQNHSCHANEVALNCSFHMNEEEEAAEDWEKRVACVLLKSGNRRLLISLKESIANGVPCLAKASLVTLSWMSRYVHLVGDTDFQLMAFSILMPQLLLSLNSDKDVEERVIASYALLCLIKCSACVSMLPSSDTLLGHLQNLSLVTWTADHLVSFITRRTMESIEEVKA